MQCHPALGFAVFTTLRISNSNNHDKEDWKIANVASTSGASGAGPVLAAIPAVSVTMTITKRTLLVSLFVLKFPSL